MARKTAHVHFIHDGLRGGTIQRRVAFPIVYKRIDDDVLHRRGGIISFPSRRFATVVLWNNRAARIWIEKDFSRIKAHSIWRIEWPVSAIGVDLPRFHARHEYVP